MTKNIGTLFMDMQAISVHDANRARRLLNCGCPKKTVVQICQTECPVAREPLIRAEEQRLYLLPLALPSPFN